MTGYTHSHVKLLGSKPHHVVIHHGVIKMLLAHITLAADLMPAEPIPMLAFF
jgi:hypothetical protein